MMPFLQYRLGLKGSQSPRGLSMNAFEEMVLSLQIKT